MPRLSKKNEKESSIDHAVQTLLSKYGFGDDTMHITQADEISISQKAKTSTTLSNKSETRFTSEEHIGSGGMKMIQLVKDENMKRIVARASIHPSQINEQNIEMFIREARLTAALEHPNIIPIYDIGQNNKGEPYFIMKHLDGLNLRQLLNIIDSGDIEAQKSFPIEKLIRMFLKICLAVDYAHENNILHLDLKPDNIHISSKGKAYVVDWGLSKIIGEADDSQIINLSELKEESLDHTMSGNLKGTPGYMASEQIIKKKRKLSPQTDVYGLGCILYSILCHEVPVNHPDLESNLRQTLRGDIKPPSKRRKDIKIDKQLESIAMKAMQRLPKNRYANVSELIEEIKNYLHGRSSSKKSFYLNPFFIFSALLISIGIILYISLPILNQKEENINEPSHTATLPTNKPNQLDTESISSPPPVNTPIPNSTPPKAQSVLPPKKNPTSSLSKHLVGWWKLDKQEGDTILDYSQSKNEGKLHMAHQNYWTQGVYGESLAFINDKSYASIPFTRNIYDSAMSISIWLKVEALRPWTRVISYNWVSRDNGWIVKLDKEGNIYFAIKKGHKQFRSTSKDKIILDQWYHIVGTYDGKKIKIYANGVPGSEDEMELKLKRHGNIIISASHSDHLHGMVDDVRLFNVSLSKEEILQMYRNGVELLKKKSH